MANIEAFQRLADMVVGARAKRTKQHDEFLATFRGIVETVPTEVVQAFDTLSNIPVVRYGKKEESWGILLTAADYIFWKTRIADGWRIKLGAGLLVQQIAERLAKAAEESGLEPAERKSLIELLEQVEA